MGRRPLAAVLLSSLLLTACATADQPATPERLGRFMGLVAQCGCSDIPLERMLADYPRALGDRYSPADVARMRGFIETGGTENFSNQIPICADACSQTCLVNAVVQPLGGRTRGDGQACTPTERRLNLTPGWQDMD
ncbi:MAG: hypothetical protein NVV74_11445 [Magnetospirillum sp.]|nr:hypothetical protein [Magnetospirillum sp.]